MPRKSRKGKGRRRYSRKRSRGRSRSHTTTISSKGGGLMVAVGELGTSWDGVGAWDSPAVLLIHGKPTQALTNLIGNLQNTIAMDDHPPARMALTGAGVYAGGKILKGAGVKSPSFKLGRHRIRLWG